MPSTTVNFIKTQLSIVAQDLQALPAKKTSPIQLGQPRLNLRSTDGVNITRRDQANPRSTPSQALISRGDTLCIWGIGPTILLKFPIRPSTWVSCVKNWDWFFLSRNPELGLGEANNTYSGSTGPSNKSYRARAALPRQNTATRVNARQCRVSARQSRGSRGIFTQPGPDEGRREWEGHYDGVRRPSALIRGTKRYSGVIMIGSNRIPAGGCAVPRMAPDVALAQIDVALAQIHDPESTRVEIIEVQAEMHSTGISIRRSGGSNPFHPVSSNLAGFFAQA
ncbi:hypothetical protein C8R47DRAFT_1284966 [Mycena vitilis]|nr:hypothetical protein C8R47DRAFT_1284966 [Mycena vitilis]